MKKIYPLAVYVVVILATIVRPIPSRAQTNQDQAHQAIEGFFQAMADLNFTKMRSFCQPDFQLLENGEEWTLSILEDKLKPNLGTDMQRTNFLHFIKTTVKGKTAWVSYHNSAHIVRNGQTREVHWLESAVLEKTRAGWKIALLHSTVVPPKK